MPKRVAVIDIGSNSIHLAIYQRSSRYGFFLLERQKSRIRIAKGAYENGGELQEEAIKEAFEALEFFKYRIRELKVRKVHAIATSAVREAPNRSEFISLIKRKLDIKIKVIDGNKEAYLGAIGALNLLPIDNAITIDIGGGSSDIALIRDKKIIETFSLKLGTVRIKELFTDKNRSIKEAKAFIKEALRELPDSFKDELAIGIGGASRAIARAIMIKNSYPLNRIHGFKYSLKKERDFFKELIKADYEKLYKFNIKKGRLDTIREGALIFDEILKQIGASEVLSSGTGLREGVFLSDLLRNENGRFPCCINPSITSIKDRFDTLKLPEGSKKKIAKRAFETLKEEFNGSKEHLELLLDALKLSDIGKILNIDREQQHSFYIALNELNYGFSHKDILTIALILNSKMDKLIDKNLYQSYKELLPKRELLEWLSFIYQLALILKNSPNGDKVLLKWENKRLFIYLISPLKMTYNLINDLKKPTDFKIELIDTP